MTITREWLSWDEPCLPQAALWLIDHHAQRDECDLREVICVLPGSRAGRLLLAEMIKDCEVRTLRLLPPRVLTPGAMVDELLEVVAPVASELESRLAWMDGLRSVDASALAPLAPQRPANDDWRAWDALARTLASLHEALAGERRDFADAGEAAANLSMPSEGERWQAIATVHAQQRIALARQCLVDRHDARHEALMKGSTAPRQVVLVGVADLNAIQKATLRLPSMTVRALVHAPAAEADAFDDLGTVRADAWQHRQLAIDDRTIAIAERSGNQVQEALRFVRNLNASLTEREITFGVGDAAITGDLAAAAQWAGVAVHDPLGTPMRRTAPWRLLDAAADWLEEPRFEYLANLLRHVDVERWVIANATLPETNASFDGDPDQHGADQVRLAHTEWLTLLDRYFTDHLQGRLTGAWLGDTATKARLRAVHAGVQWLLSPLIHDPRDRRPLQAWCQPVLEVLASAYAMDERPAADGGQPRAVAALTSIDAVLAFREALDEVASSVPGLQPEVNAGAALRMLLDHLADVAVRIDRAPRSIETLGWLELHLDPAPALAILGVNDGRIPEAVTGHAFLPDGLRTALGMAGNVQRYARDAYLLQAIAKSRKRLRLIVGRRNAQGDPLSPSRLLLACDDATLVRRVREFADDRSERVEPPPIGLGAPQPAAASRFTVPMLPTLTAPQSMRVTDFRAFLQCPYRYALGRLLGLQSFADDSPELDPMSFGSLAHRALAGLGDDATIAASEDAEAIFEYLRDRLRQLVRDDYGSQPLPAVRLQAARLEQRLRSFARFHAREVGAGWRIRHCERAFRRDTAVKLDVPGQPPMLLHGTIDRIDENIRTGAWRVIDYKTSERAKPPFTAHHNLTKPPEVIEELEWTDLQLPLYHLLATRSDLQLPADRVELGYIVLPKRTDGVEWHVGDWTPAQIAHGIETAREVVRAIRRGEYDVGHMQRDIDAEFDDFARICQTTVFRADANEECEGDA